MRVAPSFAIIVVCLAASSALSAAEPTERSNPYVNLFNAQLAPGQSPALPARPVWPVEPEMLSELTARARTFSRMQRPAVVCGMTLVPGDPRIDARIFVPAPRRDIKPKMRIVPPATCRP
jgi:hypothetical protein